MEQKQVAQIVDWNHEAQGVARVNGKVIFIQDALPGDKVYWHATNEKKSYITGVIDGWLQQSWLRVVPRCEYYSCCGGCNSQHIEFSAQVALKQRAWLNQMRRIAKAWPDLLLAPIYSQPWHYRERVRLAVAMEHGQLRLGFRAKSGHEIVDIEHCMVLPSVVSQALPVIKAGLRKLATSQLEAININVGHEVIALSVCMPVLSQNMVGLLDELVAHLTQNSVLPWQWWWLQGHQVKQCGRVPTPTLAYTLPQYQLLIPFQPQDFTQVNHATNALMVQRAMQWLQPQPDQQVIDWFCGLGNFSLAIARLGAQVMGVEGVASMCLRARENAQLNGLGHLCHFKTMNLFKITTAQLRSLGMAHQWLLDPPRAGAQILIQALSGLNHTELPQRIVYISCDPATLARDVRLLLQRGYRYCAGGMMNLFAQTAHVESIAVFEWPH